MYHLFITFNAPDLCTILNSFDYADHLLNIGYIRNMCPSFKDSLVEFGYLDKNSFVLDLSPYDQLSDLLFAVSNLSRNLSSCQNVVQLFVLHDNECVLTANF